MVVPAGPSRDRHEAATWVNFPTGDGTIPAVQGISLGFHFAASASESIWSSPIGVTSVPCLKMVPTRSESRVMDMAIFLNRLPRNSNRAPGTNR